MKLPITTIKLYNIIHILEHILVICTKLNISVSTNTKDAILGPIKILIIKLVE